MIKNERQYRITKSEINRFEKALADFTSEHGGAPSDPIRNAQRQAIQSQLDDLREDVKTYDALRAGQTASRNRALSELSKALIEVRIALGLTQKELAARLELQEQQIQRYEETDYSSASLERVIEVADALEPIQFTCYWEDPRRQSVVTNVGGYIVHASQVPNYVSSIGGVVYRTATFDPLINRLPSQTKLAMGNVHQDFIYNNIVAAAAAGATIAPIGPLALTPEAAFFIDPFALGNLSVPTRTPEPSAKESAPYVLKQTAAA